MVVKTLVVVTGPTAVGKTALTMELAQHYGVPIINADSRKGCQVIVEGDDNPIKFEIYDILQKNRK